MGNIDPFFKNSSEKVGDKAGTSTTAKEAGPRQSKAVVQGLLSKGTGTMFPFSSRVSSSQVRAAWPGACSPQRGAGCQVLPKQFPGTAFETDTARPNVGLEWDPGPTRKAAASKRVCLDRLRSSEPHPVVV